MMSAGKVSDTSEGSEVGPIIQVKGELDFEMDAFSEEKNESFGGESISNVVGNMRPHDEDLMPVTILSRTRKKNAEDGRRLEMEAFKESTQRNKVKQNMLKSIQLNTLNTSLMCIQLNTFYLYSLKKGIFN